MQLLVLILKETDLKNEILKKVAKKGVKGCTVLEGSGMAESLEDLPIFGMSRHLKEEVLTSSKVMLFVLDDDQVVKTRNLIKQVADLSIPNTGIMFCIPITYAEGGTDWIWN